jgi:hypothetical protein
LTISICPVTVKVQEPAVTDPALKVAMHNPDEYVGAME